MKNFKSYVRQLQDDDELQEYIDSFEKQLKLLKMNNKEEAINEYMEQMIKNEYSYLNSNEKEQLKKNTRKDITEKFIIPRLQYLKTIVEIRKYTQQYNVNPLYTLSNNDLEERNLLVNKNLEIFRSERKTRKYNSNIFNPLMILLKKRRLALF